MFELKNGEKINPKFNKIKNTIEKKGFDYAALIYSISNSSNNGGKLGWIKESSLSKKISDKIKKINDSGLTDVIVLPGGFLILKI